MKKQFIAGATCPNCHKMDTLVVYEQHSAKVFECVDCGHQESISEAPKADKSQSSVSRQRDNMIQWINIDNE